MLNFVLNPPNFKISCFFPFINDFRETDGDWLHRFIYLFAALSVCVQRNLKRLNHMNAPSVSVPQPPADFSCCILRQTALYLLELKLTMLQHAHEMLLKKNVQTKLEKAKESKFPSLCLSPAQQHTITTTPQLACEITDYTRVALMSKSLDMFSLCHTLLVDLGQRFLCNHIVKTKRGCIGKKKWSESFATKSRLEIFWAPWEIPPPLVLLSAKETLLSRVCSELWHLWLRLEEPIVLIWTAVTGPECKSRRNIWAVMLWSDNVETGSWSTGGTHVEITPLPSDETQDDPPRLLPWYSDLKSLLAHLNHTLLVQIAPNA